MNLNPRGALVVVMGVVGGADGRLNDKRDRDHPDSWLIIIVTTIAITITIPNTISAVCCCLHYSDGEN